MKEARAGHEGRPRPARGATGPAHRPRSSSPPPSPSPRPRRCAATSRATRSLCLYTRYENPTLRELEDALAALEGAEAGLVFASGMAAITTALFSLVQGGRRGPGERVALRRHHPLRPRDPARARGRRALRGARRPPAARPGGEPEEPRAGDREPHQPDPRRRGHRGGGALGARARAGPDRRQHLRHARSCSSRSPWAPTS